MRNQALKRPWPALALLLAIGAGSVPAAAVIISTETGSENTSAPLDDPGFARVGVPSVASVVYLGNGWVLTANHVGDTDVTLGGVVYPRVPDSRVTFTNPDLSVPDLAAYRIDPHPDFPILPIRATTPANATPVVMIGHGVNRGGPVTWGEYTGFIAAAGQSIRWGTNVVEGAGMLDGTAAFATVYDPAVAADEAQGAYGDSGGAVYAKNALGDWELAGIMFTVGGYEEQPYDYHLEGNATYAVDLASYRDQIIAAVRPECSDEAENDGDALVDHPNDPGCTSPEDLSETPDCNDGLDNDGDGLADFGADPGCRNRSETASEDPACNNGLDDDGDTLIDGGDPQCAASPAWWTDESAPFPAGCGIGYELVLVIPPLAALRRRRARHS
jgi:hypothetical protein